MERNFPFKVPVSHTCLAGIVVASWSLTQEIAGLSPFTVMTNILSLNSANSVKTFRKNSNFSLPLFTLKEREKIGPHIYTFSFVRREQTLQDTISVVNFPFCRESIKMFLRNILFTCVILTYKCEHFTTFLYDI